MKAKRAVIDTNVLISAVLSPKGTAAAVTRYFVRQGCVLFSAETFAEFETRLMRPKFDPFVTRELRLQIVRDFSVVGEWVKPADDTGYSRDPDDDKFILAARAGNVDVLVSGDADLTDLKSVDGIPILSPRECWEWLNS